MLLCTWHLGTDPSLTSGDCPSVYGAASFMGDNTGRREEVPGSQLHLWPGGERRSPGQGCRGTKATVSLLLPLCSNQTLSLQQCDSGPVPRKRGPPQGSCHALIGADLSRALNVSRNQRAWHGKNCAPGPQPAPAGGTAAPTVARHCPHHKRKKSSSA